MFGRRSFWYICIGVALAIHIGVSTTYAALPDNEEMFGWLNVVQHFLPTLALVFLWTRLHRITDSVFSVKFWTGVGLAFVVVAFAAYFILESERWFAWTTIGTLALLVVFVANSRPELPNTSRWLLGAASVFLAMGIWECLYQIGVWFFYDFFGSGTMSFVVTIGLQFLWIIPALIIILKLHQQGYRFSVSNKALVCLVISAAATLTWFVTGMDIPLLFWQGRFTGINEAARPWLISVSRASQAFWLVGVALILSTPKEAYEGIRSRRVRVSGLSRMRAVQE